jgi:hypothetical protein
MKQVTDPISSVQEKGFTRALKNGGAETIELVEMELKWGW